MGEDEATEIRKIEKKIKQKLEKGKENEHGDMVMREVESVGRRKGFENVYEKDEIVEKKKKKKRDKEKKMGLGDSEEVDIERKGVNEGKLVHIYGEESNGVDRRKKKKKKHRSKDQAVDAKVDVVNAEEVEANEAQERQEERSVSKIKSKKDPNKEKNQKTMRNHKDAVEKVEGKKRKREKKKNKDYDCHEEQVAYTEAMMDSELSNGSFGEGAEKVRRKKKKARYGNDQGGSFTPQQESVIKNVEGIVQSIMDDGTERLERNKRKKKDAKSIENISQGPTPNKSNKKVRFSCDVEVFSLPNDPDIENDKEEKLVIGKRFTREEDKIVKEAVLKFVAEHDLGQEGLDMVLNPKKHPQVRGCWRKIGACIPYRPYVAIYYRAQVLFRRSEHREWTQEEYEMILKHQEVHGNQWKALAEELGKHRFHVKDTWRRIKLPNMKKGNWSQEEYQQLFDLVNTDLQLKVFDREKRSKHGMLRDNICWTAISDRLATRAQASCCIKWYQQLTSPMVVQGVWADADDYRMVGALYSLDASCMEDVDWDNLLENRSGDVCRKRWNQMVLHIGYHGNKSFAEQVEVLAKRYCPHLLEAREAWDSKPLVP